MEGEDAKEDVVHPEVRAHINSLVSALGGASTEDDGQYKLGDDALEVLRDLKKWIRFYDEKTNRMDVARCLAEANLVGGDLLQILALWPQSESESVYKARIALACFEVMVPLTWPIDKDPEKMTINHHRHLPVLQLAQLNYKKNIINFDGAQILHTAVRAALPSMAMPIGERTARDQAIIKLVLFFLRNIAMISPPPGVKLDGEDSLISRPAVIDAFSYQDIFLTLLTIASNMGEDFRTEDVVVMEIIFHLVKRVDSSKLFMNEKQLNKARGDKLTAMLQKEAAMLKSYKNNAPTRHNRFGSMIWVKRDDGKMSAVTGQDALLNPSVRESKMDSSKKFRPPKRARKEEMEPKDLGPPVSLNSRANGQLRSFVEEFLDSGFNPLFQHVRKSMDREAPYVLHDHHSQFFYLVAWFLEAERMRRKSEKDAKKHRTADEIRSFNLVAGVLNQEMFITLTRSLDRSYNDKDWQLLTTVMRCYTQILLTVQEMFESGNEEDEEIADNILSRLFYEEATHDAIASIVRNYKDQGFEYLDASTELAHTYLRILEAYSKQNVDLQVRSRKRTRSKKKAAKAATDGDGENRDDEEGDESADDEAQAERTSRERKFDFKRYAMKFIPQGVVDTFVQFTRYYRDLDDAQLKRAHRYFYRVAFKLDMSVMLFRIDIIHLFYNMIKGPEPLDRSNAATFKEWEELAKQIIKKCVRKIEERPALITELLFSKIQSTAHYLEFGFEKQTVTSNPRPAAELEFRQAVDHERQVAIAVGALLDKGQEEHVGWVKKQLTDAESERRSWEDAQQARLSDETPGENAGAGAQEPAPEIVIRPDSDTRRNAMFKNPHLRLLMSLVGITRLAATLDETPDSVWVIAPTATASQLHESIDLINKAEFSPPTFEDGKQAADQLRRKSAARRKRTSNDEDGGQGDGDGYDDGGLTGFLDNDDDAGVDDNDDDNLEFFFAAGGPTARAPDQKAKKKKGLRRGKRDKEPETEEQLDARAAARRAKELEKARRIKSSLYVDPEDDEEKTSWDAEFFAREESRQKAKDATFGLASRLDGEGEKSTLEMLLEGSDEEGESVENGKRKGKGEKKGGRRKRKSEVILLDDDDEEEEENDSDDSEKASSKPPARKRRRGPSARASSESGDDDDVEAAGPSTQSSRHNADDSDEEMNDTDDTPLSSSPRPAGERTGAKDAGNADRVAGANDDDEDDEDIPVAKAPAARRPRVRAGFIMDSSDEE